MRSRARPILPEPRIAQQSCASARAAPGRRRSTTPVSNSPSNIPPWAAPRYSKAPAATICVSPPARTDRRGSAPRASTPRLRDASQFARHRTRRAALGRAQAHLVMSPRAHSARAPRPTTDLRSRDASCLWRGRPASAGPQTGPEKRIASPQRPSPGGQAGHTPAPRPTLRSGRRRGRLAFQTAQRGAQAPAGENRHLFAKLRPAERSAASLGCLRRQVLSPPRQDSPRPLARNATSSSSSNPTGTCPVARSSRTCASICATTSEVIRRSPPPSRTGNDESSMRSGKRHETRRPARAHDRERRRGLEAGMNDTTAGVLYPER